MDGDDNSINPEALKQACDAQGEMEDYLAKRETTRRGSKAWKRYDKHWGSALNRMYDEASRAVPELRRERQVVDQLNDAYYKLRSQTDADGYVKKVYPAFVRFADKWREHARSVEQTLKRLCSPPVS